MIIWCYCRACTSPCSAIKHTFFYALASCRDTRVVCWSRHYVMGSQQVRVTFLSAYIGSLCCQMLQVRIDDFPGSRVHKIHLCHAPQRHFFMHSSISPMIDVRVLIQTRPFILVNMGSNQTPLLKKRFYQVKIKSLEVASLWELGQLMGQLQRQAFRKAYGKIWDLATIEVSVEAIASLTQYYDQPLRCFTFEDF